MKAIYADMVIEFLADENDMANLVTEGKLADELYAVQEELIGWLQDRLKGTKLICQIKGDQ